MRTTGNDEPAGNFRPARPRLRALACILVASLLAADALVIWWTVTAHAEQTWIALTGTLVSWLLFLAAAVTVRWVPARAAAAVVVAGAVLLGLAAVSAPPSTSNDAARYAWDGMVQKAGVSPYRYTPADPALAPLRPDWLFAAPPGAGCAKDLFPTGTETIPQPGGTVLCTAINRPQVHTIYPAVAELYFAGIRLVVPGTAGFLMFQLAGLGLSLAVGVGLLAHFRRTGRPAHLAAWWLWSPLVVFEAVNNAHVDVLAAALLLVAALALQRGHVWRSGAAFGAAVATKLIPAIAAPSLLFRRPWRFMAAAAGTFCLVYVPYVLSSGWSVIGFLPGYLSEEGYDAKSTSRFALLRVVLPDAWALPAGLVLLALLAAYCLLRPDRLRPENTQLLMMGGTLLIVSPGYPWYALLLVPFIALSRRYEYVAVPLALTIVYLTVTRAESILITRCVLAAAVVVIATTAVTRRWRGGGGKADDGARKVPALRRWRSVDT